MPRALKRARALVPAARFVLPVSGHRISLREPTGVEDLLLADAPIGDPALALALIERLAWADTQLDFGALAVVDIDTLILRLRKSVIGDQLSASMRCDVAPCASRVEFSFRIDDYLEHHRPRALPDSGHGRLVAAAEAGWYRLGGGADGDAEFRLPVLADQIAVAGVSDPVQALAGRCIRAPRLSARLVRRIERAMQRLAPALAGPLQGSCPDCGARLTVQFEARSFCLQELRDRARFVYDDIDALAGRYHWSERSILRLPQARRASYADRLRRFVAASV
jgi:hypothetical protein